MPINRTKVECKIKEFNNEKDKENQLIELKQNVKIFKEFNQTKARYQLIELKQNVKTVEEVHLMA